MTTTGCGGRPRRSRLPATPESAALAARFGTGLMALGVVVGIGAGLGAVAFRELILAATRMFTGHSDYSARAASRTPICPRSGCGSSSPLQ